MKIRSIGTVLLGLMILASCTQSRNIGSSYSEEPTNAITYQQFYDDLSPYGQWVNNPDFGYVWAPRATGFRPYYSNGHWAYTNYGWTWVSDYNWGWATFHYGRWFNDNNYGWMWVPGYDWAPAWVSWRQNNNYYGWAPLCPRRRNGTYYDIQNDQWSFVPNRYINSQNLNNYYINNQNNITIINNTTIINKTRVVGNGIKYQEGPAVADVERVTNAPVRTFPVKQSSVAGDTKLHDGVLHIYKPVVKSNVVRTNNGAIRPLSTDNSLPGSQPDGVAPQRNTRIRESIGKARTDANSNPNNTAIRPAAAGVNDNFQSNENGTENSPAIRNTNRALDAAERRRRVVSANRQTENGANSTMDNTPQPARVSPAPARNQINNSQQPVNSQPQKSVINQRPAQAPNPAMERSSRAFERRAQAAPQSPASNASQPNKVIQN